MTYGIIVVVFILLLKLAEVENLTPYVDRHGSYRSHREIRDCHREKFGQEPHEIYPAHTSPVISVPYLVVKNFLKQLPETSTYLRGHYAVVSNPMKTFSILEPNQAGGCDLNIRQTVAKSALQKNCVLAVNAGFFNTRNGSCYGNVVSDGKIMHDNGGIQNAHFGLTKDGNIFAGYLSQEELYSGSFQQLVGGIVLVLKEGKENVNFSKSMECESTEETGSMDVYTSVLSARTIVGHDKDGKIVIVQVDGKTHKAGASIYEMEVLAKELGLINAVNLDGGGSATFVVNGTVVNIPSDFSGDGFFTESRKVSTILCVHDPYCEPEDCSGHGKCVMGQCVCEKNWHTPKCDQLFCGSKNCSAQGICTSAGCFCQPGWAGDDCESPCKQGWYGLNCQQPCLCLNNATCDHVIGACSCKPGFVGAFCQHSCPNGFFGLNCASQCFCENSCYCDAVTGKCDNKTRQAFSHDAAHCISLQLIKNHLAKNDSEEERKRFITMIFQSAIITISVTTSVLIVFFSYTCYCQRRQRLCRKKKKQFKSHVPIGINAIESSDSSSESEAMLMKKVGNS